MPRPCVRCHLIAADHWPNALATERQLAGTGTWNWDWDLGCLVEVARLLLHLHPRGIAESTGAHYSYTYSVWHNRLGIPQSATANQAMTMAGQSQGSRVGLRWPTDVMTGNCSLDRSLTGGRAGRQASRTAAVLLDRAHIRLHEGEQDDEAVKIAANHFLCTLLTGCTFGLHVHVH